MVSLRAAAYMVVAFLVGLLGLDFTTPVRIVLSIMMLVGLLAMVVLGEAISRRART